MPSQSGVWVESVCVCECLVVCSCLLDTLCFVGVGTSSIGFDRSEEVSDKTAKKKKEREEKGYIFLFSHFARTD